MTEPSIVERVAAGAAWLDQHRPGWLDRIDLITLDLCDPCNCVLGQEFGDWIRAPDEVRRDTDRGFYALPVDINDDAALYEVDADYAALTEAWRTYVLDHAKPREVRE